jgi:hypothetical protein
MRVNPAQKARVSLPAASAYKQMITKGENVIPAERESEREMEGQEKKRAVDPPLGFRTLEPELG